MKEVLKFKRLLMAKFEQDWIHSIEGEQLITFQVFPELLGQLKAKVVIGFLTWGASDVRKIDLVFFLSFSFFDFRPVIYESRTGVSISIGFRFIFPFEKEAHTHLLESIFKWIDLHKNWSLAGSILENYSIKEIYLRWLKIWHLRVLH